MSLAPIAASCRDVHHDHRQYGTLQTPQDAHRALGILCAVSCANVWDDEQHHQDVEVRSCPGECRDYEDTDEQISKVNSRAVANEAESAGTSTEIVSFPADKAINYNPAVDYLLFHSSLIIFCPKRFAHRPYDAACCNTLLSCFFSLLSPSPSGCNTLLALSANFCTVLLSL